MTGNDKITNGTYAHDAGIIPRVLYQLFAALSLDGIDAAIRCSFIELYNEDLRDLISDDESRKITIESAARKSTGVTRGQESVFIESAEHGLEVLQHGLQKRQVAETKMNDLSSRSHTIFTLTVYMGMKNAAPKPAHLLVNDAAVVGKINLVDLAGSENIGKSGAENKRAREAGMINQSLLTLGRVINALVDKSPHIPYRESKLTRLLQDSLGGQTRTCIIATISPAQINVEETLSTLEYASKAKNIKNKAQVGALVSKTTMFKEWSSDFVRLRRDWDATRRKNGTFLADAHYKELLAENDDRQLRIGEQERKLATLDGQLKAARDVLDATRGQLIEAKKQLTSTSSTLSETMSNLACTEKVLKATKTNLAQETKTRKAHAVTERELLRIGSNLISKLDTTVKDLNAMQDAIERREEADLQNQRIWRDHRDHLGGSFDQLDKILKGFGQKNEKEIKGLQTSVQTFKSEQGHKLGQAVRDIDGMLQAMQTECQKTEAQTKDSKTAMDAMLQGLEGVRAEIKARLTEGLAGVGRASETIVTQLTAQIEQFTTDSTQTLADLGTKCRGLVHDLSRHSEEQAQTIAELRDELVSATTATTTQTGNLLEARVQEVVRQEAETAEVERAELVRQFEAALAAREAQASERLKAKLGGVHQELTAMQTDSLGAAVLGFETGMARVSGSALCFKTETLGAHDVAVQACISSARATVTAHTSCLTECGVRMRQDVEAAVAAQGEDVGRMLVSLDGFVGEVRQLGDQQQAGLAQMYHELANSVNQQASGVRSTLTEATDSTTQFVPVVACFETQVQDAWSAVTRDSSTVLKEAVQRMGETRYVVVADEGQRPNRRMVEYERELPVTMPEPVHQAQLQNQAGQQRSPLSDISKTGNEVMTDASHLSTDGKHHAAGDLTKGDLKEDLKGDLKGDLKAAAGVKAARDTEGVGKKRVRRRSVTTGYGYGYGHGAPGGLTVSPSKKRSRTEMS